MPTVHQFCNNFVGPPFVVLQMSFSTADIQRNVFYAAEQAPIIRDQPVNNLSLLAVHGDMFVLTDDTPEGAIPLTEESGLFQIVALDQQT